VKPNTHALPSTHISGKQSFLENVSSQMMAEMSGDLT